MRCRVTVQDRLAGGVVRLATEVRRVADGALILEGEAEVEAPKARYDRDDIEVPGLIVQRHRHFAALLDRARPLPALPTAVVCPDEPNALGGALLAMKESLITPILLGRAAAMGADLAGIEVVDVAAGLLCGGGDPSLCRACKVMRWAVQAVPLCRAGCWPVAADLAE